MWILKIKVRHTEPTNMLALSHLMRNVLKILVLVGIKVVIHA